MVKNSLLIIFLFFQTCIINAQVRKGMLKATTTFSIGLQREATQNYYLSGLLEFQLDDRFSVRGDGFYFIGSSGDRVRFDRNHQVFAGLFSNFKLANQFYAYTGLQTGVAYSRGTEFPTLNQDGTLTNKPSYNPIFSGVGGLVYYAPKWFHVFVETRYVMGKHQSDSYVIHLDEWRFTFGLGFHLYTLRNK